MRPGVGVGVHPGGDRRLDRGQVGERPGHVQQLAAQRAMPPLHLLGRGRRVRAGQLCGDAVLAADPLEQHLGRPRFREPAGELLAIVDQRLRRHPVRAHRRGERVGDRPPPRGPRAANLDSTLRQGVSGVLGTPVLRAGPP